MRVAGENSKRTPSASLNNRIKSKMTEIGDNDKVRFKPNSDKFVKFIQRNCAKNGVQFCVIVLWSLRLDTTRLSNER